LLYYVVIFVQPLPFKNAYDGRIHDPYVEPFETGLMFLSLVAYLSAALRRYSTYRCWLLDNTSAADEHGLFWLRNFLVLFSLTVLFNVAFELYSALVRHLNYFDLFPLYVWYAALVDYLALEGWRNSGRPFPQPMSGVVPLDTKTVDWEGQAKAWSDRVLENEYWRDPDLTLASLAERMNLSPSYISRLVNEGLDQNFNEVINRMRVAWALNVLRDANDRRDVLEIGLDSGFSSKASFNRSFKTFTGTTPTAVRRESRLGQNTGE
jgi:AraC-like DNA-binding protein